MDPYEYQKLAERLITRQGSSAADRRSAISRAYYAAYHQALQVGASLHRRLAVPRNSGAHLAVQNAWRGVDHEVAKQIAFQLGNLHSNRIAADYDLSRAEPEALEHARHCVGEAASLFETLRKVIEEPLRTQLVTAIQGHSA